MRDLSKFNQTYPHTPGQRKMWSLLRRRTTTVLLMQLQGEKKVLKVWLHIFFSGHAWEHSRLSVIFVFSFFSSIIWLHTLTKDSKFVSVFFLLFRTMKEKILFDVLLASRGKMNGKDIEEVRTTDANAIASSPYTEQQNVVNDPTKAVVENPKSPAITTKKKNTGKSFMNFLYDPQNKTVLGRSSLNWGKFRSRHHAIHSFGIFQLNSRCSTRSFIFVWACFSLECCKSSLWFSIEIHLDIITRKVPWLYARLRLWVCRKFHCFFSL